MGGTGPGRAVLFVFLLLPYLLSSYFHLTLLIVPHNFFPLSSFFPISLFLSTPSCHALSHHIHRFSDTISRFVIRFHIPRAHSDSTPRALDSRWHQPHPASSLRREIPLSIKSLTGPTACRLNSNTHSVCALRYHLLDFGLNLLAVSFAHRGSQIFHHNLPPDFQPLNSISQSIINTFSSIKILLGFKPLYEVTARFKVRTVLTILSSVTLVSQSLSLNPFPRPDLLLSSLRVPPAAHLHRTPALPKR